MILKLILTCEHGGNTIPATFSPLYKEAREVLDSHRGYDPGALDLFRELGKLAIYKKYQTVSRLLVELNRSLNHPKLFSTFTKEISSKEKRRILERYYFPYRQEVEERINYHLETGERILHLSIHSFTPQLNGKIRNADIGLLYDPGRKMERQICRELKSLFLHNDPSLKVRFNYPYRGTADGFTTYLRKKFPLNYAGIEIEVNQNRVADNKLDVKLKDNIFNAVSAILI